MTPIPDDARLDEMQWIADPHADEAIAAATCECDTGERLRRIEALNAVIRAWHDNAGIAAWRPDAQLAPAAMGEALARYVTAAQPLPDWADRARIARAEKIFMETARCRSRSSSARACRSATSCPTSPRC